jgi:hypothetical protein
MAQGPEGKDSPHASFSQCSLRLLRRPGSLADVGGASPDLVGQFVRVVGRVVWTV